MRVLVTGAAGFLGSHLVDRLLADGHRVIGLDNFFSGSRANVEHLDRNARFEMVRGDVCEPFHHEVDLVYHLACPASPVWYQRNPVRTIETAVVGTRNALRAARETGAKLVITSTSEVYGDPLVHPQPESYWGNVDPVSPRSCYDEGKRCGEALAAAWVGQYATDVRVARLFNVYGPRMSIDDGRVIPTFVRQAMAGEPLTVYGDGLQTRSFCYVSDVVEAFVRLAGLPAESLREGAPLPIVNIGNPDERTVLDVAGDIAGMLGGHGVEHRAALPADPRQRKPDIGRARRVLGWEPKVSYAEGMRLTVEWFLGRNPVPA